MTTTYVDSPRRVTRAELGGAWPLAVEGGDLRRIMDAWANDLLGREDLADITLTVGGVAYGVNGRARTDPRNRDIAELLAPGHTLAELVPLIKLGHSLTPSGERGRLRDR